METYLGLALTGALVSLLVQGIKQLSGLTKLGTVTIVVILSVVAGGVYYQFSYNTAFWEACLQVLLYANAVYGFLLKPLQKDA